MIVCLTPDAQADLAAIGDDIARERPRRAANFIAEMRSRCGELVDMRSAFPLVTRYGYCDVRHRAHRNCQIFYRVVSDPMERVDVLHIVRGARGFESLLF
jgi:toxin ParE1/3/4